MTGTVEVTILGCGSSGGVPRVGGDWGACDPKEPKNRRTRCSIWVDCWNGNEKPAREERTSVIIDTSPDLRQQLLGIGIKRVDALFFSHEHADQTHGIDDLRALAYRMRQRVPTYMDQHTYDHVYERFKYCFEMPEGRVHPPILELQPLIKPGENYNIDGPGGTLNIQVLGLSHGPTSSLGFIFANKIAYTPDVHSIEDETLCMLQDIPIWIMDGLRYSPHPTHAHIDQSLKWIAKTRTQKAILTNMHIDMDYNILQSELTGHHQAAYDGMRISVPSNQIGPD